MVVVLLILLLFQTFRGGMEASQTWNYREFEEAVDSGDVVRVEITQNQEVPTGSLKVTLTIRQRNRCKGSTVRAGAAGCDYA